MFVAPPGDERGSALFVGVPTVSAVEATWCLFISPAYGMQQNANLHEFLYLLKAVAISS